MWYVVSHCFLLLRFYCWIAIGVKWKVERRLKKVELGAM